MEKLEILEFFNLVMLPSFDATPTPTPSIRVFSIKSLLFSPDEIALIKLKIIIVKL